MFIRGLIRGLGVDRRRILIQRTPLRINYPTVPKKEIVIKVIERGSVGSGKSSAGTQKSVIETQRASSSSSPATTSSTSKKTTTSAGTITKITPTSTATNVIKRPPTVYSSTRPYAY